MDETEQYFRLMADKVPVMIRLSDRDKQYTHFNRTWLEFTGKPIEGERGSGWVKGVHPDDVVRCLNTYVRAFDAREPFTVEYRLQRHDRAYRWILESGAPRVGPTGTFAGYIGSAVDVTDQRFAKATLASLSRQLIETQDHERTSIAAELHDDICQRIVGLNLKVQGLAKLAVSSGGHELDAELGDACNQLNTLARDVQRISHQLHPAMVDVLGIVEAARDLCRQIAKQYRMEIDLRDNGIPTDLSRPVSHCLYRVLQETLAIAVRQSGARLVAATLTATAVDVRLEIVCDGVGFECEATSPKGLGLISLNERLTLVGGVLDIESVPGTGTRVRARVPLDRVNDAPGPGQGGHSTSSSRAPTSRPVMEAWRDATRIQVDAVIECQDAVRRGSEAARARASAAEIRPDADEARLRRVGMPAPENGRILNGR
jgi:PAS domain S-box-containing protein